MIDLIRAEMLRLRTTRMALWLALSTVAGVLLTVPVAIQSAGSSGLPALDSSEGIRNVLNGAASATTVALILGILAMAGEFRHSTATSTVLVTPDRGRVVAAKLVSSSLAGLAYAAGAAVLTLAVAIPWLATKDIHVSLLSGDVATVFLGAIVATALYGAIGVGVGALVRNQTLAVAVALVWMLIVEGLLVSLLPEIGRWLPGGAASALTDTTTAEGGLLPTWGGGLLFAGYAVLFAVAGTRFTLRQDIS
jgi:ABC-2 type transport system permease protein